VAWAGAETHDAFGRFGNNGFLWLSVLWGVTIAWLIARDLTQTTGDAVRAVLPHVLLMAGSTYAVVGMLR
jgi:hypothetical protein